MKLPDFQALGQPKVPNPTEAVASYGNAEAPGAALTQFGATAQQAGSNLQDLINIADVNNAYANIYSPEANKLAANFYSLQGKAAVDARPQFQQDMTDLGQRVAGTLNGQAATHFTAMEQPHLEKELYAATLHSASQGIVYSNQAAESMVNNDMANYKQQSINDPASAEDTLHNMIVGYTSHLQKVGAPPERIQEASRLLQATAEQQHQAAIQDKLMSYPGATQKALLAPIVQSQQGGLPQDMGGDTVRPYSSKQVANIRSLVNAPSAYDSLFKQYGEQYGVDPQELKLHAAAESSMNPKADNGQSKGLMQISNDNVKSLGVTDPFDPAQSIQAAAQLMAKNKASGATDNRAADLMYYGGPNPSQQGPNSHQYAENLAAVRGSAAGGAPGQMPSNPEVPAWLAKVNPSTISKLSEMADATASREARLTNDKQEAVVDSAKRDFFSKVADGSATSKDALNPNLPTDKIPEYLRMVAQGDKVDPNSVDVIKQRGVLENMKVENPTGFKALDLSTMAGKLPASDISKLQGDQMAMKKGDTSLEGQNKAAKSISDSVADMLPLAWQHPKKDNDEKEAAAFKGNLISAVQDASAAGGPPMGRDDIRKIASDMLAKVSVKGGGWFGDSEVQAYQVPKGTSPLSVYQGSPDNIYVPQAFRTGITRAWQSKFGQPPQETDIRAAYLKSIK